MELMLLLPLLVSFPCLFFICRSVWRNDSVPIEWPLIGKLPSLLLSVHRFPDWCTDILKASGHTFEITAPWFIGTEALFTCDPANILYITKTNFSNYNRGSYFTEVFDVLGDGIFTAASYSWRIQRKLAVAATKQKTFRLFASKVNCEKVVNGLVPLLEHMSRVGHVVDLQDVFQRFTFDSVCMLVFGVDPGCLSVDFPLIPFAKAIHDAEEALFFRMVLPKVWWKLLRWVGIGEERKLAKACKTINGFIREIISKRKQELKKSTVNQEEECADFLTFYLGKQVDEELGPLKSDKFLRDTTFNLFVAGKDTNGAALTWFFWLLSKHPSIEKKLLEEVRIFSRNENWEAMKQRLVFDTDELCKLVYLHACLCESMRLFPPIPLIPRSPLQPDVLPSGTNVRPSTMILYSTYASGRMEEIWGPDCLEFKPERWISKQGTLRYDHQNFFVFGAGPRNCLGKDVVLVQMKAVAAAILYNFHVDVLADQDIRPLPSVVLTMENGLMVKVRKRSG